MSKLQRYSSYKESGVEWVGEIPEHWEIVKLKFLLKEKVSDGPHETPKFIEIGIPFLSVDGIQDGELTFDKCRYVSGQDHNNYSKKANVTKGSILIGKAASTGKIAQVKVDFPFSIWSPLALIKPNNLISSSILEYYLKSHYSQIQIDWLCNINTQKNIGMGDIPKILVVLPPIKEQNKIASFLDQKTAQIDQAISQKEKMIELLKERRQIVINEAVTKGINPNVPMKDSGVEWIGEIPEHWEISRVKNIFKLIIEPAPNNNDEELLSIYTDIGVRPRKDLKEKGNKASTTDGYWRVKKGDFIVNKLLAWMGAVGLSEYEGVTSPAYDILRAKVPIEGKFYHELFRLKIFSQEMKKHSRGIMDMRLRLYFDKFGDILIPYPSYDEQQQIVAYIEEHTSKIDCAIDLQQNYIAKLKEYKTTLIDSVVTGKVKVA